MHSTKMMVEVTVVLWIDVEDGRLLPKSSTSATVNTVGVGNKSDATIRLNVRFELDENSKSNPDRHCEKDC
jgi:hypothetical protein